MRWHEGQGRLFKPEIDLQAMSVADWFELHSDSWDQVLEFYRQYYEPLVAFRKRFVVDAQMLTYTAVEGPRRRPKHFPPGGATRDDIRRMVDHDHESRFLPELGIEKLTLLMQDAIAQRIDALWPPPSHEKIDIDARRTIGISLDGESSIVRFDCSFDSRSAHAYPITAREAQTDLSRYGECRYWESCRYLD